jgi:hypothetical protein
MIPNRPGFLVLPVAFVCLAWLGDLALDSLHFSPVDPCVEEAAAVAASYGPRFDAAAARLQQAPPGSPEPLRLEQECRDLLWQAGAEIREVYRRHGRELPSWRPGSRKTGSNAFGEARRSSPETASAAGGAQDTPGGRNHPARSVPWRRRG